ncbi:NAD(P)(+) transhydrogenase (Re/Si-specific) subunit beta [Candidatus Nitrotoga sp. M5]|uniref:NAD(P)(+) transhydrogenase (Re/Si-specific) subunit beta n=1 Tax=Candidatus Nitrotoga sp. M5 TaxID=2890409 RepID=UPI001EF1941B|nr:NAD(P)(+) transhydrogenase (Re/Si-specific) subunit beta [Candidatus Nitrotoga sp. M5]CAH1385241.1 pyridine nucleotide transhydrogenase subunit beta [Candidatus Nitrotoga sp. M5]
MSANFVALAYLVAAVLFILALKGLSSPISARNGNMFGMIGMAIAVLTTLTITQNLVYIVLAIIVGGSIGAVVARRIQMTAMPELVAAMHSLVGLAAVLVAMSAFYNPVAYGIAPLHASNLIELFIGTFVGAITFTGSIIAFGKLSGKLGSKPLHFTGQHWFNLFLGAVMIAFGIMFIVTESWTPFLIMIALALALGVLLIMPIGGADMPVVVSMLNSYSGWAAAGIGFTLNNNMLIIAGSLVGSSGAILSYIMCKAMNRSFFNVILGGFGGDDAAGPAGAVEQRPVRSGSADDAAFLMGNAGSVIIVPGYGLAVARAQHAINEMSNLLIENGVNVRYAIHPVAGRMPGHMNVLLAEAEVPYDQVLEMDEINNEFADTDVVLVIGANDVVNPAAKTDPQCPIYGMPIIDAHKARTILVVKRSMAVGYAGLDNDLFYLDKTMMVFGDAKKVVEDIIKALQN